MTYGFIGLGNMASAIIRGMKKGGFFEENTVCGHDASGDKMAGLAGEVGILPEETNTDVVKKSDVIVLCVKPQMMEGVLKEIFPEIDGKKLFITIAAGKTLGWYEERMPEGTRVVRVMPNINARALAAAVAVCPGKYASEEDGNIAVKLFETVGKVYFLPESQFSVFTAICGSSIAFTFMYIDALATAGVKGGLPKAAALDLAIQSVQGCVALMRHEGTHPMELVDQVCSPAGTTIEGVMKVRELGFENTVYKGIEAIMDRDKSM